MSSPDATFWDEVAAALPAYLVRQRWFGAKARTVSHVTVSDRLPLPESLAADITLGLFDVEFTAGLPETYLIPIAAAVGQDAETVRCQHAEFVIEARTDRVLYDATFCDRVWQALLQVIGAGRELRGSHGRLVAGRTAAFERLGGLAGSCELHRHTRQQSHSSAHFGERLMLKLFRKLAEGRNPDLEIGEFLTHVTPPAPVPALAGWLEYQPGGKPATTLALLQQFIPNESDAWTYTLAELGRFCDQVRDRPPPSEDIDAARPLREEFAPIFQPARLLGRRTGELHAALGSNLANPDFAPEQFSADDVRQLQRSMRATITRACSLLRAKLDTLPADVQSEARRVAEHESQLLSRLDAALQQPWSSPRIRVHGDYHLGQVLWTGSDFVIIDFEGEPDRPIAERRLKQSPLKDVAGMLRSFDYASQAGLMGLIPGVVDGPGLRGWLDWWSNSGATAFFGGYLSTIAAARLTSAAAENWKPLDAFLLEKLAYELAYELNSRPDWVRIPLAGLRRLITAS